MYSTAYHLLDDDSGFHSRLQLQDGQTHISDDGNVLLHEVAASGGTSTKSSVSIGFAPVTNSGTVVLSMDFYIPEGQPTDSITIADFESANASVGGNPGVRVYMRDGQLRIDRAKILEDEAWGADQSDLIETGQWYSLRVEIDQGVGADGGARLYLDGELVLDQTGTTILTQDAIDAAGANLTLSGGELDRVQVGLTSNKNDVGASIATRDVSVGVEDASVSRAESYTLEPMAVLPYADQIVTMPTAAEPIAYLEPARANFFVVKGGADDDILTGDNWMNVFNAGAGNDTINAGAGDDTMFGGSGDDHFVFDDGWGLDRIRDFSVGEDKVVLNISQDTVNRLDAFEMALGTVVHDGENGILIEGVAIAELSLDDFILV